jgi:hypothetical protein
VTAATTLSLVVSVSMLTIQEASAAKKCNNSDDDDANNHNKDDNKTCATRQQHSKNHDPSSDSNTKISFPFRLPMPFP